MLNDVQSSLNKLHCMLAIPTFFVVAYFDSQMVSVDRSFAKTVLPGIEDMSCLANLYKEVHHVFFENLLA